MKIQEFRSKMKAADRPALEKVAAELYKRIPKKNREDEIDPFIEQLLQGVVDAKPVPKDAAVPFEQLNE